MATITEKQTRRNRVQFTMPTQLYDAHQRNLEQAKELGAIIDFNRDFERWFCSQVDQVAKELERMKEDTTKTTSTKPKASSTKAVTNQSHKSAGEMANEISAAEQTEVADGND